MSTGSTNGAGGGPQHVPGRESDSTNEVQLGPGAPYQPRQPEVCGTQSRHPARVPDYGVAAENGVVPACGANGASDEAVDEFRQAFGT